MCAFSSVFFLFFFAVSGAASAAFSVVAFVFVSSFAFFAVVVASFSCEGFFFLDISYASLTFSILFR